MDALSFLEGSYSVNVEAWTQRGSWYPMGNTSSTIEFVSPNLLREQITYERIYRISLKREFAYSENSGSYFVSEYNDLTTAISLYSGNLSDTTFVFDDTSVQIGEMNEENPEHSRYVINNIETEGFILERHISSDKGETWNPRDRFTYLRIEE
jgi:hypothetical protein